MTLLRQMKIQDDAGNIIDSHADADGDYHLGSSLIQTIISSTNNYTDANLAYGVSFTGVADETFGIDVIRVFHTADQDCTVYIDQSVDSAFADSTKTYTTTTQCLANEACTRSISSVAPYYRLRVTNTDLSEITTNKLETATGMIPVSNPLPAELSGQGNLQVVASVRGDENYDRHLWISPTSTAAVNTTVRLVGTNFDGLVKDTNFWTEIVAGTGTTGVVTQTGEIKLTTSIAADGSAKYVSVRRARFVVGSAMQFTGAYKFNDALVDSNVRRCGAYDSEEGFFFELDGTVFNIGSRKTVTPTTTDTLVASGSFNGNIGPHFTPDPTKYYKLDIEWTPLGAFYYVNNELLHKSLGGHLTRKLSLPITFENVNEGSTTDVTFDCLGVVISRLGELNTEKTSYAQSGTIAALVLKQGAGELHGMILGDVTASSVIILYDNVAASGTEIFNSGSMEKKVNPFHIDFFKLPFSIGLTLAITTQDSNVTVIYE